MEDNIAYSSQHPLDLAPWDAMVGHVFLEALSTSAAELGTFKKSSRTECDSGSSSIIRPLFVSIIGYAQ